MRPAPAARATGFLARSLVYVETLAGDIYLEERADVDSKNPGPVLRVTHADWAALIRRIKAREFDLV